MSDVIDPERAALAQAKLDLIDAARAVNPLSFMRPRPLVLVGVAAGVGAAIGASEAQLFSPAKLIRTFSLLARTAILILATTETNSPDDRCGAHRTHGT
jgi:hypothetical protein